MCRVLPHCEAAWGWGVEVMGAVGRRLPKSLSSTYCELDGLLDVVTLLNERGLNGLVICDSKSAMYALSSPRPAYDIVVQNILCRLASARDSALVVSFVWVPFHEGSRLTIL